MKTYFIYLFLMLILGWKLGTGATSVAKDIQEKREHAIAKALQDFE